MWPKSIAALIGGCLVSVSLMLNLNYLLPLATDVKLLIGVLIGFPMWVAAMVYCYASEGGWHAWKRCGGIILVSASINGYYLVG